MIIKNKKILVIGGAGFIGSHTVELLLKQNPKKIIIFDNLERGKISNLKIALKDPRVEIFKDGGDILKLDLLNEKHIIGFAIPNRSRRSKSNGIFIVI